MAIKKADEQLGACAEIFERFVQKPGVPPEKPPHQGLGPETVNAERDDGQAEIPQQQPEQGLA